MTHYLYPILLALFFGSFLGSYYLFPKIITVAQFKKLNALPIGRSSHHTQTPNIGGLVFFIAMIFGVYLNQGWDHEDVGLSLVMGMVVLLFIGLKDDLMVASTSTKFLSQLGAIILVLFNPAFHIDTLHGFLGIDEIPIWVGISCAAFVMLAIINAFNFIDGIDGLAAMLAMVIFFYFGVFFFGMGLYLFASLNIVMIGSLGAFLRYNLSSDRKIFMGDTGSMLLGFLISCEVIGFFALESEFLKRLPIYIQNIHVISLAILIVPFFDSIRVVCIRLINRKSPFKADRNHLHHILIDHFNFSHAHASVLLANFTLIFAGLFFIISEMGSFIFLGLFSLCLFILVLLFRPSNYRPPVDLQKKEFARMVAEVKAKNRAYRSRTKKE